VLVFSTIVPEPPRPTDDLWIRREDLANLIQCSGRQSAVGVKEQQYLATRFARADTDCRSATRDRNECLDFVSARNLSGSVPATSVHYNHFVFCSLLMDSIEQTRQ